MLLLVCVLHSRFSVQELKYYLGVNDGQDGQSISIQIVYIYLCVNIYMRKGTRTAVPF